MNQIIKIISVGICLLFILGAKAQEAHNPSIKLTPESNSINHKLPGLKYYIKPSYRGSEFLTKEWCTGDVVLENGDRYNNLTLRLNTYLDELIQYNERIGAIIMLDKSAISEFTINFEDGHTELFRKINSDKFSKGDKYFSVLHEGKMKVLLSYETIHKKTDMFADETGVLHDLEFVSSQYYYLVFPNGKIEKFTLQFRSFLEMFPEQKREIRRLLRKNYASFSTNEGIVRIVQLIESKILQD